MLKQSTPLTAKQAAVFYCDKGSLIDVLFDILTNRSVHIVNNTLKYLKITVITFGFHFHICR